MNVSPKRKQVKMSGFDFKQEHVGSAWGPDVDYPNREESVLEADDGIKAPDIKFKQKKVMERYIVERVDIHELLPGLTRLT